MRSKSWWPLLLLSLVLFLSARPGASQDFEVRTVQQEVGLREKPGFIYKEVGRLLPGEEVIVDAVEGDWAHVANMGWIPVGALGGVEREEREERVEVAVTRARLRGGPGTDFEVTGSAREGEVLAVREEEGGWLRVGESAWVHADLVRPAPEAGRPAPETSAERLVRVTASRVNVRSGPSTDEEVVGAVEEGETLRVVEERDGWLRTVEGHWIYAALTEPVALDAGSALGLRAGGEEIRQWGLLSLLGVYIKLIVVPDQSAVAQRTDETLDRLTGQDRDYTFMTVVVDVPPTTRYRFNFSPAYNRVQVTDSGGRRFGNFVHKEGDLDALPAEVRALFQPAVVFPGNVHTGLLAFSGELDPSEIDKIEVYISGQMQELYEER